MTRMTCWIWHLLSLTREILLYDVRYVATWHAPAAVIGYCSSSLILYATMSE